MFQSKHFNPPKSSKLFLCKGTAVPSFKRQPRDRFEQEGTVSLENNVCSKNDELCVYLLTFFIWNDAELT